MESMSLTISNRFMDSPVVEKFHFKNPALTAASNAIYTCGVSNNKNAIVTAYNAAMVKAEKSYVGEYKSFGEWAESIGLAKSDASLHASVGSLVIIPYAAGNTVAHTLIDDWHWTVSKLAELRPLKTIEEIRNAVQAGELTADMTQSKIREAVKAHKDISTATASANDTKKVGAKASKGRSKTIDGATSTEIRATDKKSHYRAIFTYDGKVGAPFAPCDMAELEKRMNALEFRKVAATTWVRDNRVAFCDLHEITDSDYEEFYDTRRGQIMEDSISSLEIQYKSGTMSFQDFMKACTDLNGQISNSDIMDAYQKESAFFPVPVMHAVENEDD